MTVNRLLQIVFGISVLAEFLVLGMHGGYIALYSDNPRSPDPATFRTVPYTLRSTVVYLTEDQREVFRWLGYAEVGLIVLIVTILLFAIKWPLPSLNKDEDGGE